MPTYAYKCSKCHHTLEAFQKINDPRLTMCPRCNESELRQIPVAGLGFQLQGSGWYNSTTSKAEECCPCGKNKADACPSSQPGEST